VEGTQVNTILLKLYIKFGELAERENGQDMVEYALCVALLTFGATAATKFLASGLSTAYGNISSQLTSYVS
jgi:Flp pilus assembly pilin Flp